jgi:hypothetical protein
MSVTDTERHQQCMQRFIELANAMKREGIPSQVVSAGLMTASGVYATYVAAGNQGGLTPSGVEKITEAYRQQLEQVQRVKKDRTSRHSE